MLADLWLVCLTLLYLLSSPLMLAMLILAGACVVAFAVPRTRRSRVLKLKVKIGEDAFEFEGATALPDILPVVEKFYEQRTANIDRQLTEITGEVRANKAALEQLTRPV